MLLCTCNMTCAIQHHCKGWSFCYKSFDINITVQIMEDLPNFTISFEQHLAMFWPAKAMNPNENDSN